MRWQGRRESDNVEDRRSSSGGMGPSMGGGGMRLPGGKGGIDALHHLAELVLAGDGMKLARIKAVYADVNRREARITPTGNITCQAIAVGGHSQGSDRRVFAHGGNDVGKIAA